MAERAHHPLTLAVLGGVATGGLVLLATSRPWAGVTISSAAAPRARISVTGADAVPLTAALALVVLAGSAAVLPTTGWLRRGVGSVVAAAALIVAVIAATADDTVRSALAEAVSASPAALASGDPPDSNVILSWWRWVAVVAALGGLAAGSITAWRGHTWAVMGRRYDGPASAASTVDDSDPWRAMDAGRDPTQ